MRYGHLISLVAALVMLNACGVYTKWQPAVSNDSDTTVAVIPSWQEYFTDAHLRALIDSALCNNSSIVSAQLRLRQADESLKASKLAYIPSLAFSPNGGMKLGSGGDTPSYSYNVPLSIDWNFGSPGTLFARRHQAQARRIQAQDMLDAVRNSVISQLAVDYYMLQMLDRKVAILEETVARWTENLQVQKELMDAGKVFYSSVAQMESKILDARQDLVQTKADILTIERSMHLILGRNIGTIERSESASCPLPSVVNDGVTIAQLRRRPDVRAAERDLEIAYYLTSESMSAFYPSIRLTGDFGWPMLINAAISLMQPIFSSGSLKCRLNISRMDQEIVQNQFTQIILQASTEVSQALADYRMYAEKASLYAYQKSVQQKACYVVENLQMDGKANYLELIKAQETLLDAQENECESIFKQHEAAIMLFKALAE